MKKDLILKAKDIKIEEIDLVRFGVPKNSIFAKSISAKTFQVISQKNLVLREGVELKNAKPEDWITSDDFLYTLIVESVCDEKGNGVFTDEDIPALKEHSQAMIMKITEKVNELNSMTEREVKDKEKK
jgi:hypothetical protein